MKLLGYFLSLGKRFFRRSQLEAELEEELQTHIQERADSLEHLGLTRGEAERRARIEFGSPEKFKEECRETLGGTLIDNLFQDLRFGWRMLWKSPGFSAVAILTMAFGIGATTAIFSMVDAMLLKPLPYPQPEQLVRIMSDLPGVNAHDVGISEPEWQDLQHSGIFDHVSPAWYDDNNLTGGSEPARVSLLIVAPNYFSLLGVKPELGRTFPASDHSPGFTQEAVISDGLWRRMFGADPNILERSLRLDTDLYHVVGVMPPSFRDPATTAKERNIEVWAATSFYGAPLLDHPPRSGRNLPTAIARIKSGLTIAEAQSRVDTLVASLQKQFPSDYSQQTGWRVRLIPLKESLIGNTRLSLTLLFVAMGLVLIIGCANIANLLLARANTRGREMAVRRALGATRVRLASQLLTESVLLALLGGILGVAILFATKEPLLQLVPEGLPQFNEVSISWGVSLFALGASLVSGLIFGLSPALQAARVDLTPALKQEGRRSTASGRQVRTRRALAVTEFALSLVLMIAAGLLVHSFWNLLNAPLGFDPQSVITIKTRLPYPNVAANDVYNTPSQQAPFFTEILRRCRILPGVMEAAFGDLGSLPLGHDRNNQNPPVVMMREGYDHQNNEAPLIDESIISPEYFHLMGIPLLRGRLFGEFDNDKTESVAVINEAAAQVYWPNDDVVGKHIKLSRRATAWTTIVGIVANARTESLENARVPQIYSNIYQRGAKHLAIFLRGNLDLASIPDQVREQVQAFDRTIPVFGARPLSETVSASLAQRRFSMRMIGLFALTALFLATLGIYGVTSYIVSERTHEIGIRLALGADNGAILRMILGLGLRLALAGAGFGLVGALVISWFMGGLLYGVKPTDPVTFVTVTLLFGGVTMLACYLPAHRAMNVDPIVALRDE